MDRPRVLTGRPLESEIGFSRAIRVGNRIEVSGTAPTQGGVAGRDLREHRLPVGDRPAGYWGGTGGIRSVPGLRSGWRHSDSATGDVRCFHGCQPWPL